MGRADQTTKVRGMFVHPGQVAEVARRHPEIARARLEVTGERGQDAMTLVCEVAGSPEGRPEAAAASLTAVTKLRGGVRLGAPGELPRSEQRGGGTEGVSKWRSRGSADNQNKKQ